MHAFCSLSNASGRKMPRRYSVSRSSLTLSAPSAVVFFEHPPRFPQSDDLPAICVAGNWLQTVKTAQLLEKGFRNRRLLGASVPDYIGNRRCCQFQRLHRIPSSHCIFSSGRAVSGAPLSAATRSAPLRGEFLRQPGHPVGKCCSWTT